MVSFSVKALIRPPTRSISWAIWKADRRPGALEQHVLEEVREAVLPVRLVAGPVVEPVADAEGVGAVDGLGEQERPARQPFRVGSSPARWPPVAPVAVARPRGRSPPRSEPTGGARAARGRPSGFASRAAGIARFTRAHPVDVGQLDLDLLRLP